MKRFFITGTDTGVGKTCVAAILTKALSAHYWKPIQSGEPFDIHQVKTLTALSDEHFYSSVYQFQASLSPHEASALEKRTIDIMHCSLPNTQSPLIIEGAGGVFVPLNERETMLDLMQYYNLPVIIVTRGTLGTINHTLLTINALKQRNIAIAGIVFNGALNPSNQKTIETFASVKTLFHVPEFSILNHKNLTDWIYQHQHSIVSSLL